MNQHVSVRYHAQTGQLGRFHFHMMENCWHLLLKISSQTSGMWKQVNKKNVKLARQLFLYIYNYIGHKTKVICIDDLGEHIANVSCTSSTFTIAWHPKRYLLAYACDEKDKYDRDRSVGLLKVYGFPNEESATSRATGATGDK